MKYIKINAIIWLCTICTNTIAQDTLRIEQRVKLLEEYNEKILKEEFETQSHKLSSSIEIELEKAKAEISDQLFILEITGGVISFILAAGLGVVLVQYFRGLQKMADKVLKEKLKTHLEENSGYLMDLITSQRTENLIKKSKKIFIVSGSDEDLRRSLKLFKDMKFNHVEGRVFNNYEKPSSSDLIVFSARDGSLQDELVRIFLEKGLDEESYIYFGGARFNYDPRAQYVERLNFANSQYTLYHQIINVLSFKDIINN